MKKLKDVINNIIESFNNSPGGFSGRKLTAFWFVMLTTYLEYKFVDFSNLEIVISTNLLLVLLCLGIVTFEQIVKFKNGSTNEKKNSDNTSGNNSADSSNDVN
jgi:hypothetical protein